MVTDNHLYNEDELNPPEWLNKEFLETVLNNVEPGKDVKIDSFKITPGTSKSDHYASIMFRARINYNTAGQSKFKSIIIKTMPVAEGQKKDFLEDFPLFETEIRMFTETLPLMESMLHAIGDDTKLSANCIWSCLEPTKCIIFDDLVEQGYTTINNRPCKMEEVKAALMKLAKIHATSYKMVQEGSTGITDYVNRTFTRETIEKFEMIKNGVKVFKEVLSQCKDLCSYIPYVEKVEKDLFDTVLSYFSLERRKTGNDILVLNHGDFHMKNMMIRNDNDGNLEDLMLVDYQISWYGSIVMDLLYSSVMLFSPEMRLHHREELFYYFFKTFQQTLKDLGYTGHIPTLMEFQIELLKFKSFEFFLITSFLTINYVFVENGDVGKYCEDAEYRRQFFDSSDVINEIRALMPRLLYEGYFE